jgi:hypothetical protein
MLAGVAPDVVADVLASVFIAGMGGGALWLRKQLKGVGQMTRDWNGEPAREGISDGTPGVMQRLYTQDRQFEEVMAHLGRQDATLETIKHEVNYNSGSSIKDAVHRTDGAVAALRQDVEVIKTKLEG